MTGNNEKLVGTPLPRPKMAKNRPGKLVIGCLGQADIDMT